MTKRLSKKTRLARERFQLAVTEYLVSKYSSFPRREFRFAVDLRGIGKLFDFNQANQ